MKKLSVLWLTLAALAASFNAGAAGGGDYDHAPINVRDTASLQRGATMFVNYCMGCHSMQYMRWGRLGEDLNLTDEEVEEFLIRGDQSVNDMMLSSMPYEQSAEWFGKAPPDLSLTARARTADWVYTFLRSYYLTDQGWNNTLLANPAMPHVLVELQGVQRAVMTEVTDASGETRTVIESLELTEPGLMTPEEYDATITDITAFMAYAAEPAVLDRLAMGPWVLLFLTIFTFLAWLLYKEYWKDVKK
jgi:ubiquinol-cytochrome c reductase cytochrome c1 subunit